jgi:hypothetical protein
MTALSSEQLNARSYAIISLGVMCLVTLINHVVLSPPLNPPLYTTPQQETDAMVGRNLSCTALFIIWAIGLLQWSENLAMLSIHTRNQSLIFGLVAGNLSLAYLLLTQSHAPAQAYFNYTLWPAHLGLTLWAFF